MTILMKTWLSLFRRTRREYFADFFVTPPITLALVAVSLEHGASWWWPLQFAAGALLWTFYEYATHRWLLHKAFLFREVHRLHHANQRDYIAVHPFVTLALYALTMAIFGAERSAVSVGFGVAYIVYASLHTAFHYAEIGPSHPLYRLKLRHVAHHRAEVNFGVTCSLWDRLFRTDA